MGGLVVNDDIGAGKFIVEPLYCGVVLTNKQSTNWTIEMIDFAESRKHPALYRERAFSD